MIFTVLGVLGALLGMTAYMLLMFKKIGAHSYRYLGMNLAASSMLSLSNIVQFNLPSVIMQAFYISVTVYALVNVRKSNERR